MHESSLLPLYVFGTLLITGFALTLVVLLVIQKQRQVKMQLERQRLQHEHDTEMLRTTIEVQEQTLQSLASEIHDGIGQVLSVSQLQLASLRNHIETDRGRSLFEEGIANLRQAIAGLRTLSHTMHSDVVAKQQLDEFIGTELERLRRATGMECTLEMEGPVRLPPNVSLPVFRIIQEALQNIMKHAKASRVNIAVEAVGEGLSISIADDGVGIVPDAAQAQQKESLGITSMKRRANALKGHLSVHPGAIQGTVVSLFIPLQLSGADG